MTAHKRIMEKKVIFEATDIYKQYGSGSGTTVALDHVSLKIYQGELLVILGSSGSGKSTLLNMIGGMDRPTAGTICVDGENICSYSDKQLTNYRRKKVGFVFQSFNLIQELTARENVALTADKTGSSVSIDDAFSIVGLSKKQNKYPAELSGGEQQRVSIARALAKKSDFLLCDEPTGALDYETGKQILIELEALVRQYGKTVVFVTHTQEIATIADRVLRMRSGHIIEEIVNEVPARAADIEW